MGLDWLPGSKPRRGCEAEFDSLRRALSSRFCWGRARKQARLDEITVDPAETLGAPVVGIDEAADEWARQMFEHRSDQSLDMSSWLRNLHGLRVVELARPSDGLPLYSNGGPGQYIGADSFRAQFLGDCTEIIGTELLDACFVEKSPVECLAFADALEQRGRAYAAANGVDLHSMDDSDDPDSPSFHVSVVLSAARWCRFWGNAGHGMAPWF